MGFKIKESVPAPKKIESDVPVTLTTALLETLPAQERATFDSGKIEDFLIAALKEGLPISEIETRARTSPLQDEIVSIQERTIPPEIQSVLDACTNDTFTQRAKEGVANEMRALGATEEQVAELMKVKVVFEAVPGTSMAGRESVGINVPQLLRKAYDCVQGLRMDASELSQVVEVLAKRTVGHELGHVADQLMDIVSNSVKRDERWGTSQQSEENRSERFAEFMGRSLLTSEQAQLSHKERLLNVVKSAELWEAIRAYNENHSPKIDLFGLFGAVEKSFDAPSAKAFATSRKYLYSTARPENYAMPYTRDQVLQSKAAS